MNTDEPDKHKRRYIKGNSYPSHRGHLKSEGPDHPTCAGKETLAPLPSHCTKCGGSLGIRSALTTKGKVLEGHCVICGKTYPMAWVDVGIELTPAVYTNNREFLASSTGWPVKL